MKKHMRLVICLLCLSLIICCDKKDEEETHGESSVQKVDPEVRNGLFAYFTFENSSKDQTGTDLTGVGLETSFVDSYDGTKALNIPGRASALMSFPNGLIDQREMSISFWIKDLNDGHIFHAVRSANNSPAFLLAMADGKLKFVVTNYHIFSRIWSMPVFTHSSLNGWHMITLVSDFNSTTYSTITTHLYVDGVLTDTVTEDDNVFSEGQSGADRNYNTCTKLIMGGDFNVSSSDNLGATKLVIDNLRIYRSRCLSAEEVKAIYIYEKK